MKIDNPWPYHATRRLTCKTPDGEVVCLQSEKGYQMDIPDGTTEVLIEAIQITGRGGQCVAIHAALIWSKDFGMLKLKDHAAKMQLVIDETEMAARKDAERARKQEEARQRAEADKKMKEGEDKAKALAKAEAKFEQNAQGVAEFVARKGDPVAKQVDTPIGFAGKVKELTTGSKIRLG